MDKEELLIGKSSDSDDIVFMYYDGNNVIMRLQVNKEDIDNIQSTERFKLTIIHDPKRNI